MRFRIRKNIKDAVYSIVVAGEMDDNDAWDILQIAQTMLSMPHCRELIIDLQETVLEEEFSIFNSDTLVSVFEEGLMNKDCALVVRFNEQEEIRFSSDQSPLERPAYTSVSLDEAKFFSRAMQWLGKEARLLVN